MALHLGCYCQTLMDRLILVYLIISIKSINLTYNTNYDNFINR